MFKNYLTVSIRNLLKNKLFSLINIAGLSIGLSSVLMITLYIWDEFTFDSYLNKNNGLYKLEMQTNFPGRGPRKNSVTAGALAPGLLAEYPELVAGSTRINRTTRTVTVDNRSVSEYIAFTDASFFELFDIEFAEGNKTSAMPNISTVAISQATASKYFPNHPALGQTINLDNGNSYKVGAVYKDFPENTHIRPNFLFPMTPSNRDLVAHDEGWWSIGFYTYVRLKEGVAPVQLEAILHEFIDRHLDLTDSGQLMSSRYGYNIYALEDVHFETAAQNAGDPLMLTGFAAIAFVILSIATFNFMNMSVSRSVVRAREVAIRKVFGAGQSNIINLFLNETLLTVIISLFFAIVITELSLIWFNDFVTKLMTLGTLVTPSFIIGLIGLVLAVSLGAGLYPAKILANFRPATVLRGGRSTSKTMSQLGTILVTAQFAVAIGLIIAATVIYQQINYSQSMNPGYQKENLLLIRGLDHRDVNGSLQTLKDRIRALPHVTEAALVDQAPGGRYGWMDGVSNVNGTPLAEPITIRGMVVSDNFANAFGMSIVAGRTLTTERSDDISRAVGDTDYKAKSNILLNEQALQTLGLGTPTEAVGKTLGQDGAQTIVGIVGDYLTGSSKSTVPPMMFTIDETNYRILAVRFKTNDVSALTADINSIWSDIAGSRPIRLQFMDDRIAALYQTEQQQGELFALFAGLSVLVSCIGLYGLASFSVARRTKEIGLRKVLGASTTAVARHILWDFSRPILVANIIAWPITAYLMDGWLQNFNYAISLGLIPFISAAILALAVAAVTVGGHALKVATANPINALRYE